jgi:class 3 adenylate cyclase
MIHALQPLGIEVRTGLHTGECEVRGDDLTGLAVHIAARVGSLAGAGQVLVSSTVKDLVVGSRIEFEDRGEHDLKGVPGPWRLFAVSG